MKNGDLIDFFGITVEVDSAVGAGYSPCKGCDLAVSSMVPNEYCTLGKTRGCAGAKYGNRIPDNYPDDAFIFVLQPCNGLMEYFEKCPPPRYWRMKKALPPAGSP